MRFSRYIRRILAPAGALLLVAAAAGAATAPPRPTEGHGSDFYLVAGAEGADLRLDPRGSEDFVAAGLDPRTDHGGLVIGVGWSFRRPLRLDLTAAGWEAEVDRPGASCTLARAAAELHLALAEGRAGSLEATFMAAFLILDYQGTGRDEHLPGSAAGVGLTGRLRLVGPIGLGVAYQYQLGRFEPKTFELEDGERFRVQPTARLHGVRVTLYLDL